MQCIKKASVKFLQIKNKCQINEGVLENLTFGDQTQIKGQSHFNLYVFFPILVNYISRTPSGIFLNQETSGLTD